MTLPAVQPSPPPARPSPPRPTLGRRNSVSSLSSIETVVASDAPDVEFTSNKYVFYEGGKVEGDTPQVEASFTFSHKEIAQALDSLLAFLKKNAKGWVRLYKPLKNAGVLLKNACLSQNKLRITYPTLPTVEAKPVQAELSIPANKPGTKQLLEEALKGFSGTYDLLVESKKLLTGATCTGEETVLSNEVTVLSNEKKVLSDEEKVLSNLKQYETELTDLEKWLHGTRPGKPNTSELGLSSAHFAEGQALELETKVDSLSRVAHIIYESSKSLRKEPRLNGPRFYVALAVGLGYLTSAAIVFFAGVSFPILPLGAGLISVLGAVAFDRYGKYKEPGATAWRERIAKLNKFTEQLKSLKEKAKMENLVTHKIRLDRLDQQGAMVGTHDTKLVQHEMVIKNQEQRIEELQVKLAEKEKAEAEMRARLDKIEAILLGSSPPNNISFEAPQASSNANKKPNAVAFG